MMESRVREACLHPLKYCPRLFLSYSVITRVSRTRVSRTISQPEIMKNDRADIEPAENTLHRFIKMDYPGAAALRSDACPPER